MSTIRIRPTVELIAPERLAALVTRAVVAPTHEDGRTDSRRLGSSWIQWYDVRQPAPRTEG